MSGSTASAPGPASDPEPVDVADLCFSARALAQSHPMTDVARRYRRICFDRQRADQPLTEFADWAATALDVGYCLRRVEEDLTSTLVNPTELDADALSTAAALVADQLRTGDPARVALLPAATTVAALDRLIATELDKRADNVREQLDESDWKDLEDYIAWWVVHGYAVRAAESAPEPVIGLAAGSGDDKRGSATGPETGAGTESGPRILVIGVGNLLHGDDGFGVEVARRLEATSLPDGVVVAETGIGGIHMVHELMSGFDAVIVVDAVDRGRPPGTVMVIEADVIDVAPMPVEQRHDQLADMHLAIPERALMVAKAVGVLPERTLIVGCQPAEVETLGIGLTDEVSRAVHVAVATVTEEIERCRASLSEGRKPAHPSQAAERPGSAGHGHPFDG